ncbi:hypothetical protein HYDPIDRAFT_171016 [Hydnomerulius pinastri MD-312]|uniref:Uncharacterized protein n=1 Tax=Hydnomerulius pinastri MD-312 TaxID=994086 RepID=A0A0C9VMY5_9AGAM|nr:hypothetical protein HYDPIDRAFT_171016 [Hydnomerulius pinastri MD-312]
MSTPTVKEETDFTHSSFMIANLTVLYNSMLVQGCSNDERQAIACALLRHKAHLDATHYQSRTPGGLHPSYVAFNPSPVPEDSRVLTKHELVEASLGDVFDVLFVKSLPFLTSTASLSAVVWRRLSCWFIASSPSPVTANPVSPKGPQHIPPPLKAVGSQIQCSALPQDTFVQATAQGVDTKSKAIQKAADMSEEALRSPNWNLSREQAAVLTKALLADMNGAPNSSASVIKQHDMVSWTFLSAKACPRLLQPPSHKRVKVILSKEARAALTLVWRKKTRDFKHDLNTTWAQINESTKKIASMHHKSVQHVQHDLYLGHGALCTKCTKINAWNTFCWKKGCENQTQGTSGRGFLPEIELNNNEKATLVEEFSKFRKAKSSGLRKSAQSKLENLHCRTGTETVLYTTRGSTDIPLSGVTFATEGVQDFMGTVMGIDNQDMVNKMEGFAIQGIKEEMTGDPNANMQWAHYFRNVIQRYLVVIEGWPDGIPFANLSNVSSALSQLEMLLRKWESGTIYWKQLTEAEFEELREKQNQQLQSGEITEHTRHTHLDKGKKRKQVLDLDDSCAHCARKGKSTAVIESNIDEDDAHNDPVANADHGEPSSPIVPSSSIVLTSSPSSTAPDTATLATAFANMSSSYQQALFSNLHTMPTI